MYSEYRRARASSTNKMERVIQKVKVPAKLVRECAGLGLDIGGSVIKVVYRTKEDLEEANSKMGQNDLGTIRMTSFSRAEVEQAFEFLKTKPHLTVTPGEPTKVNATGWGSNQFKSKLEKQLNIKLNVMDEGECFDKAFVYLAENLTMEDLVYPYDEAATAQAIKESEASWGEYIDMIKAGLVKMEIPGFTLEELTVQKLFASILDEIKPTGDRSKTMIDQGENLYPAALVVCGSAFGIMTSSGEGGTYVSLEMSNRGGRMLLAMASMFLGCKDYEEFLSLAAAGNSENVDYGGNDMAADMMEGQEEGAEQEANPYGTAEGGEDPANSLLFSLGKGVGKRMEDFKREDLAAGLLRVLCNDLAMMVDKTLLERRCENLKHFFFCGGFPANDLTRNMITRELTNRVILRTVQGGGSRPFQAHFLRHGAHLGSIGCLITEPAAEAPAE